VRVRESVWFIGKGIGWKEERDRKAKRGVSVRQDRE